MARRSTSKAGRVLQKTLLDVLQEFYRDLKDQARERLPELRDQLQRVFLEAKKRISGDTLVILGPPHAGKSTLYKVLKDPTISGSHLHEYIKTEFKGQPSFRCKWNLPISEDRQVQLNFKVRRTIDVGGELYLRDEKWKEAIKSSGSSFMWSMRNSY